MIHADVRRQIVEKLTPAEQIRLANLIFESAATGAPVDGLTLWSERIPPSSEAIGILPGR